jgi:hypothetical protein
MTVEIFNIKDEYHFQVNGKIYFGSRYLLFFINEFSLYNEDRILVATANFKRFSIFNIIIKLKYPNPAKIEVVTPFSRRSL